MGHTLVRLGGATMHARKYEPLMVRFRDAAGNNVSLRPLCAMCGCA
jgi:hypothetical protein